MNIALEQTKEYVNGKLRRDYGDAFVRGNNGICSTLTPRSSISSQSSVMYISADH